jgi:hypothetical protein
MTVQQAAAELEPTHHLGDKPWRLPALPFEARAALWPGSGQTLYSMGSKSMRQAFDKIARELGLVGAQDVAGEGLNHSGGASDETGDRSQRSRSGTSGWLARMFGKKQEISTR